MNAVELMFRIAATENHLKALYSWRLQEAIALAQTLREQRHLIEQVEQLSKTIVGAELELEFLKGVERVKTL